VATIRSAASSTDPKRSRSSSPTISIGHPSADEDDAARPHHLRDGDTEVLALHGVDAVALAGEERLELRAREVLVERDPGGVDGRETADARRVRRVVVRADDVESHHRPPPAHPTQDLHHVLYPLLRRDAADHDEAVLARLPGDGGKRARHRRMEHHRLDPVERPDPRRNELRVDERQVPPDTLDRDTADAASDAVVQHAQRPRAVIPAQVDRRPLDVELRVVDVLDAPTAEVGLVVGGDEQVVPGCDAARLAEQEPVLHEGEGNGREGAGVAHDPAGELEVEVARPERRPEEPIADREVRRLPREEGRAMLLAERFQHPGGDEVPAAWGRNRRLEEEDPHRAYFSAPRVRNVNSNASSLWTFLWETSRLPASNTSRGISQMQKSAGRTVSVCSRRSRSGARCDALAGGACPRLAPAPSTAAAPASATSIRPCARATCAPAARAARSSAAATERASTAARRPASASCNAGYSGRVWHRGAVRAGNLQPHRNDLHALRPQHDHELLG
jgi:hypothetical protein